MAEYTALLEVARVGMGDLLPSDAVGAMARCYVVASTEKEARKHIKEALHAKGLRIVEYEWLVDNDAVEWERPDSPEGQECMAEARETGLMVIGRLDCWNSES